ncbi:MAG: phage minor head protein [Bacillota bacterium]
MATIKIEPLPFEEAIEFFETKLALKPDDYAKLLEEVKVKAFTVSNISSLDVLNDILNELDKAVADGLTPQEFRQAVNEMLTRRGWEGMTPYQVDNVFRTNIQTNYNVGRYKQQTDPEVVKSRPYWIYDAVNDKRTRLTHLALDGTVRRYDDPFWDTWYPPNGFRCRCGVRTASERDINRKGLTVQTGPPPAYAKTAVGTGAVPLIPDKGFAYNPGKAAWKPDLSKYPDELQKAYRQKMKR